MASPRKINSDQDTNGKLAEVGGDRNVENRETDDSVPDHLKSRSLQTQRDAVDSDDGVRDLDRDPRGGIEGVDEDSSEGSVEAVEEDDAPGDRATQTRRDRPGGR